MTSNGEVDAFSARMANACWCKPLLAAAAAAAVGCVGNTKSKAANNSVDNRLDSRLRGAAAIERMGGAIREPPAPCMIVELYAIVLAG